MGTVAGKMTGEPVNLMIVVVVYAHGRRLCSNWF